MFESDDFDQVLSQFDFPEVENITRPDIVSTEPDSQDFISCTNESKIAAKNIKKSTVTHDKHLNDNNSAPGLAKNIKIPIVHNFLQISSKEDSHVMKNSDETLAKTPVVQNQNSLVPQKEIFISPKHLKRKIINSHFDQQRKRKFPGPAGLLTGALEETKDESIGEIEFLSQDIDFTESNLRRDLFESPLWKRLLIDTQYWKVHNVDSIKVIKQQALAGNLRKKKAQTVTAFIEAVDRSVTDPLIILRDETGTIKCTLHRDAWSNFSPYIVSEYCALVLQKPTVLTTGGAFKKHYLNITLSNILAIFSSAVLKDERVLPSGYRIEYEEDFTVIKSCLENIETAADITNNAEDIFDGLDNFFSDEIFLI